MNRLLGWCTCFAAAAAGLIPLAWMISSSLRLPGLAPPTSIEWIPDPISWTNYARLFELLPYALYLGNSLVVVLVAVPVTVVTASWAGLAITQLPPAARRAVILLSIGLLLIPNSALWLSRFVLFKGMGLIDSRWALVLPAFMGSSPLFVLLFYWSFRRIPGEVLDAARLDGAGTFTLWRRVVMPVTWPTTFAIAVLAFIMYWGDLVNPLLFLKSQDLYTLPLGIRQLQQLDRSNWPLLMAACVIFSLPAIALFLSVQRTFTAEGKLEVDGREPADGNNVSTHVTSKRR